MPGMGGDLVREARKRAGLTQRELAERAGTTQSAIARLENRRTAPTLDNVQRLIRLCGFELQVGIVEQDDSDWLLAKELLKLTPAERVRRAVEIANEARQAREADGDAG